MASDSGISGVDSASESPPVALERMPQQDGILVTEDGWTGVSSPAERRRLQNRMNQRAYRKRKRNQSPQDGSSPDKSVKPITRSKSHRADDNVVSSSNKSWPRLQPKPQLHELWRLFHSAAGGSKLERSELPRAAAICKLNSEEAQTTISEFEKWVHKSRMMGSPTSDHLLVLVKFNVFRASISNSVVLGYKTGESMDDDALSPFTDSSNVKNDILKLPAALRPTLLQRQTPHHPWIDLLPAPEMRDNLIRAGDTFDDMELCGDLVGLFSASTVGTGMTIWGDPWDLAGWEVTEAFLSYWGWTISGCSEIFQSTNYWRARRDERPLNFDNLQCEEFD